MSIVGFPHEKKVHTLVHLAQGCVGDNEENEGGIRYIATAMRNDRGEVVAAIGVS